jgi:Dullard-like phosphatase family protein
MLRTAFRTLVNAKVPSIRFLGRQFSGGHRTWKNPMSFAITIAGGGAVLVAGLALKPPSHSLEETAPKIESQSESSTEWFLKTLGIRGWINWAVEPAERAGCPPGKLLPDPPELPPGVNHRVLVLGLEDCLIHTEWDRVHGHRTKKRPGLDAFLAHASQFYEVVIFSSALQSYADPIVRPFFESGYVHHMLCRENTKYVNGKYVKDLSYLNRDLRHVVILDTNPDSYSHQPLNAVPVKPWRDDADDTELIDLVPFIEAIVREDVHDVREVIRHFQGSYFPDKFRTLRYQALERKKKGHSYQPSPPPPRFPSFNLPFRKASGHAQCLN